MDTSLDATLRDPSQGKSAARKVRMAGKLPGVVYGRGSEGTPIAVDPNTLNTIFRKSQDRNTIVYLEIDGATVPCLVREAQRHPLSREILHVDFYKLEPGQEVVVKVPLETTGRPRGFIVGGRLRALRREVPVRCAWDKIPEKLTYDVSKMNIGDFVKISQLVTPAGVSLVFDTDYNVLTVYGKRTAAGQALLLAEDEAEAEAAAEAAESESESE